MRPISRDHRETFSLPGSARTFTLRPLLDGPKLALQLATQRKLGMFVGTDEIIEETREACEQKLAGAEQEAALALLDDWEAARETLRDALPKVPIPSNGHKPDELVTAEAAFDVLEKRRSRLTKRMSRRWAPLAEVTTQNTEQSLHLQALNVRHCIVGWSGVTDEDGQEVACVRTVDDLVTEEAFALVTADEQVAIANRVDAMSELTAADQGNSASPSGSPDSLSSASTD